MKWFISLITIAVGMMLVIKTQWIYDFTGPNGWAEQHLGTSGGTSFLIKLIGLVMIFGAFLAVTGLLGSILHATVGKWLNI